MAQWVGKMWCFTINAVKNSDETEAFWELEPFYEKCMELVAEYIIVKGERGEEGNYHLQGYVRFAQDKRMKEVKDLFGCKKMHVEKCKGRESDNIRYVSKIETTWNDFPLYERGKSIKIVECKVRNPWADRHWLNCTECKEIVIAQQNDFAEFLRTQG